MFKYVVDALNSKDNIKDQIILLREFRFRKGVRKYVDNLIFKNRYIYEAIGDELSKYILYCIVKYYYGLDAKEVKLPKEFEGERLIEFYPEEKTIYVPVLDQPIDTIKVGDKFTILSGAFKGLEAFVQSVDLKNEKLGVIVELFGQDTRVDIGYKEPEVIKRERKSRSTRKNKI